MVNTELNSPIPCGLHNIIYPIFTPLSGGYYPLDKFFINTVLQNQLLIGNWLSLIKVHNEKQNRKQLPIFHSVPRQNENKIRHIARSCKLSSFKFLYKHRRSMTKIQNNDHITHKDVLISWEIRMFQLRFLTLEKTVCKL